MPNFKEPGATAFRNLQEAVRAVNAAAGGGNVDDAFIGLMQRAAEACDNFRKREPNATNVRLLTADNNYYDKGQVKQRTTLRIDFDYYEGNEKKHYSGT